MSSAEEPASTTSSDAYELLCYAGFSPEQSAEHVGKADLAGCDPLYYARVMILLRPPAKRPRRP